MRSPQLRCSVAALCVMMTGVVRVASPQAALQQATEGPRAVVPGQSHDFGTVEQGSKVVHQFTIRNTGTSTLTLTRVSLTQPGMTARMKAPIPPGEEAALSVEWNTAGMKGTVEGRAVLEMNDPARPQITFILTGVVTQPIEFLPYQAIYVSVYSGESGQRSVRIVNNRERPLGINRLDQQGEHFRAAITPIQSGKLYNLEVTVPATVPPGRYTEAVFLYTDDQNMPRLMVPVNVLVKTEVYVSPETVDFGSVSLRELADKPSVLDLLAQSVIVRKRAGKLSITAVTSDVGCVTIRRSPEGESSSEAFRIDAALVKDRLQPGPISGSIRVLTDDKQFPELIVPVRGEIR